MIYEFLTPSDPISFRALNDKVACFVTLLVGSHAFCHRLPKDKANPEIPCFNSTRSEVVEFLGCEFLHFLEDNRPEVKTALESFCYGLDRTEYEQGLEEAKDKEAYKAKHEDEKRTSLKDFVKLAWELAEKMDK